MIAVDTNILVYAHRQEFPLHRKARDRLTNLAENREPWGLPVFCVGEFLRVVTHPKLFDPPTSLDLALDALHGVLLSPSLAVLSPGVHYWPIFQEVARKADARGNLLYDAQIIAVCKEHGVRDLLSQDRDFMRFEGISLHTL